MSGVSNPPEWLPTTRRGPAGMFSRPRTTERKYFSAMGRVIATTSRVRSGSNCPTSTRATGSSFMATPQDRHEDVIARQATTGSYSHGAGDFGPSGEGRGNYGVV